MSSGRIPDPVLFFGLSAELTPLPPPPSPPLSDFQVIEDCLHLWTTSPPVTLTLRPLCSPLSFTPPPPRTMASKRKSSVPCMIPSKVLCSSEEHGTDSDTPPQPAVSGRGPRSPVDPGESSRPEGADGAGTYTCRLCNFETQDLNLFLDHVYSGHPDFCSDPRFSCVGCGVSVLKFEGLALHNARVHPSTCDTALQLKKKDGRAVVEQNLVTRAAPSRGSEISISKTPIMRMMKVKSEAKRIAVAQQVSKESSSDPGPVSPSPRDPEKKESGALTVVHVPGVVQNGSCRVTRPSAIQIVNGCGSLPELKSPVSRVSVFSFQFYVSVCSHLVSLCLFGSAAGGVAGPQQESDPSCDL